MDATSQPVLPPADSPDPAVGRLWELVMGSMTHLGGQVATEELADEANLRPGLHGVDLGCGLGESMRYLVRCRGAATMTGVDCSVGVVERGEAACRQAGLEDRVRLVPADMTATTLPDGGADFVWGEDAWGRAASHVAVVREALRVIRPGGVVAFTDWVLGRVELEPLEARRLCVFMNYPVVPDVAVYCEELEQRGCDVILATDTGRLSPFMDLYYNLLALQVSADALDILGQDAEAWRNFLYEMQFLRHLANRGALIQAMFIARKP